MSIILNDSNSYDNRNEEILLWSEFPEIWGKVNFDSEQFKGIWFQQY